VIIVGGGPVGLGAALELARFGVASVLVEKRASTSWHPKTRNFNTRTMEIARGWGDVVYKRMRSIDTPPGWKSPIRFLRTLIGEELGVIDSKGFEGPGADVSPAEPIMSSQERIEEILLDAVRATDRVEVRFSTEVTRLRLGGADGDPRAEVAVRSTVSGEEKTLEGAALVAADGASSFIRSELGLELEGARDLRHIVNCYFRADLERHIGARKGVLLFVSNGPVAGVFQPLDAAGRWLCQITVGPDEHSPEVFDEERARRWIRAGAGIDDLDVDVVSIGFWKLNATVARRFVQGRVVLCGDAAHQFPPTGGLGVNTGLQGMHNAMWKLAHFVRGQAGWGLVETYGTERRPVSRQIVDQSLQNSINVARISAAAEGGADSGLTAEEIFTESRRYGNHLGIEFGAAYASPAVVEDGAKPPDVQDSYSDYVPSATPGCRAPHVWLGSPAERFSTLDLFGPGFTLITTGCDADAWKSAVRKAASQLGVRIDHYAIGAAGLQDELGFPGAYGLEDGGAVLVRPDGHVAWRHSDANSVGDLPSVLKQILAR
jgi:2-polyprenyl-6-methoxyphenol hydroxylase-like FAD-dependent oxidoreductase